MARCARRLFVALLGLAAASAEAAQIDPDGGITLTVSFEIDAGNDDSIAPPVHEPGAEQHYCDSFQEFSEYLYATTEGAHWIKRVRFLENTTVRDVRWRYVKGQSGNNGVASFYVHLSANEGGYPPGDPSYPFGSNNTPVALGSLLNHEMGHFFYGQPDEYINFPGSKSGHTGLCADSVSVGGATGDYPDGVTAGTVCDDEELQCAPVDSCVIEGRCALGSETNTACDEDGDCMGGGICLGMNDDRDDQVSGDKQRLCLADNELSPMNEGDGVCVMAGGGLRKRWCDSATHVYERDVDDPPDGDVDFDMGDKAGIPDGDPGDNYDFTEYNCWDQAVSKHIDLDGVHDPGAYPTFAEILAEAGPVPAVECHWLVDFFDTTPHAAMLVDRSGSMGYDELSDPPREALDLAIDGSLYLWNQIPNGSWAGIYVYNTAIAPAEDGGNDLDFQVKNYQPQQIDQATANGGTDIAKAIDTAHDAIEGAAGLPFATRNIVLLSDGKDNQGGDPYAEAQQACADGIFVHGIAYGDADSTALDELSCGNFWASGTEQSTTNGFAEPDAVELKTSIARMAHAIAGEDEVLEFRDDLEPLGVSTVEERTFHVPAGTVKVKFAWLGNHTCVHPTTGSFPCDPVLNLLTTVELESPSGVHHATSQPTGAIGGVYRYVEVALPEPGSWTARVVKTEPFPSPSAIPGEWAQKIPKTRVSWVAHVTHGALEGRAWVTERYKHPFDPLTIRSEMRFGGTLTNIEAVARVTHAGDAWTVPLFDDGEHDDGAALDGEYGGIFNPNGNWPNVFPGLYRVKVRMTSTAGHSISLEDEEFDDDANEPGKRPKPGDATVEAETSFRLSRQAPRVDTDCPPLLRGATYAGLTARVAGRALDPDDLRLALGPGVALSVTGLECVRCQETASDPVGLVTFDVSVAPDAATGFRPLRVQKGPDVLTGPGGCPVCSQAGEEECNGIDDDCNGLVDEDAAGQDSDLDGVFNLCDNCPSDRNVTQSDSDHDGQGDVCDEDDGLIWVDFSTSAKLAWQAESCDAWNVYRGSLKVLRAGGPYTQVPGSNPIAARFCGSTTPALLDPFVPASGEAAHYLVTCDGARGESSLGTDSDGNERPNDDPCP